MENINMVHLVNLLGCSTGPGDRRTDGRTEGSGSPSGSEEVRVVRRISFDYRLSIIDFQRFSEELKTFSSGRKCGRRRASESTTIPKFKIRNQNSKRAGLNQEAVAQQRRRYRSEASSQKSRRLFLARPLSLSLTACVRASASVARPVGSVGRGLRYQMSLSALGIDSSRIGSALWSTKRMLWGGFRMHRQRSPSFPSSRRQSCSTWRSKNMKLLEQPFCHAQSNQSRRFSEVVFNPLSVRFSKNRIELVWLYDVGFDGHGRKKSSPDFLEDQGWGSDWY